MQHLLSNDKIILIANEALSKSNFVQRFMPGSYENIKTDSGFIYQNNLKQIIFINEVAYDIQQAEKMYPDSNYFCLSRDNAFQNKNTIKLKSGHIIKDRPILCLNAFYDYLVDYLDDENHIQEEAPPQKIKEYYNFFKEMYKDSLIQIEQGNGCIDHKDILMWTFFHINQQIKVDIFYAKSFVDTFVDFIFDVVKVELERLISKDDELCLINNSKFSEILNCKLKSYFTNTKTYQTEYDYDYIIYKNENDKLFSKLEKYNFPEINQEEKYSSSYNMDKYIQLANCIVIDFGVKNFNDVDEQYFLENYDQILSNAFFFEKMSEKSLEDFFERIYTFIEKYKEVNKIFLNLMTIVFSSSYVFNSGNNIEFYYIIKCINKFLEISNDENINKSFINFKYFLLDVYSKYNCLEKKGDNLKLRKKLLLSQNIEDYYLSKNDIKNINKIVGGKQQSVDLLSSKLEPNSEELNTAYDILKRYIIDNQSSETNIIENLNAKASLTCRLGNFTSISYELVRTIVEKEGKNSDKILKIIDISDNLIKFFIKTKDFYNPQIYQRILSLISLKNNIKLRFNMDNNLWNNKEILEDYEREVRFIIENKFHYNNRFTYSKLIDEIAKMQNAANKFKIDKDYISLYKKELKGLGIFNSISDKEGIYSLFDIEDGCFDYDSDNEVDFKLKIIIKRNEYFNELEIARSFNQSILFQGSKTFSTAKLDNHPTVCMLELNKLYWNQFKDAKNIKNNINVYYKENFGGLDYVY